MSRLVFDDFELDLEIQELRRNGHPVRLALQALRLLEFLASHPGELITRDQIQRHIWGTETFVDFEHGINKSIRQIREALKDDAESPRFIQTLPRRGYRFIGESRMASDAPEPATLDGGQPLGTPDLAKSETEPPKTRNVISSVVPRRSAYFIWSTIVVAAALVVSFNYKVLGRLVPSTRNDVRSIAVLPLTNLSGDPAQDFFADGITEELTTYLAKIAPLRVISHTSVMRYKDTRKPLSEIARELRVDAIVEGGVVRLGNRVRITAQLIRAPADEHMWAESYDREAKDILSLQDDLARDISAEINIKLAALDSRPRPIPLEAHDDYLKGRYEWNTRSPSSLRRALGFFQQAAVKDPDYAAAYAGLAGTYAVLGVAGYDGLPISEAMSKAKVAAMKAIQIDASLSEAHSALAFVNHTYDWNWQQSEREFKRALALNPSDATAHQWYSEYLCNLGRWPESIAEAQAASALNPNSLIINENLARPYYYSRQFDKAIQYSKKTLELDPSFAISHLRLGRAYAAKGMYSDASKEFQKYSDLVGGSTLATASLANLLARGGDPRSALHLAAELRQKAATHHVPAYQFAIVYAGLGNAEEAIQWLEEAYRERNDFLLVIKHEPIFDGLRGDQRFQDIERRIGL